MHADFDLGDDGEVSDLAGFRRGFHRPEGGRPKGYSPKKALVEQRRLEALADDVAADAGDDGDDGDTPLSTTVKTAMAKARKETALAGLNELQLKVKSGEYLPRAAYQEATATLLSMLSQGLRSLPDTIERKFNVPTDVLQLIEAAIDDALNEVAETLALFAEPKA